MKRLLPPILRNWDIKQSILVLVWGIYSLIESFIYFNDIQDTLRGKFPDGSVQDFLIYHHGNFNNSVFVVAILDALLSYIVKNKVLRLSVASFITATIFLVIESNDLPDYPVALAGILVYILLSPK